MSDLVGNPEDRFSGVAAHILHGHVFVMPAPFFLGAVCLIT